MNSQSKQLQGQLWAAAEQMRANSGLNLNQISAPILGLIFLKFADVKFKKAKEKLEQELLAKLKQEKLVLDWREKESTRAGVKTTISDILYDSLPEPIYSEKDCEIKGIEVYNFVYEHYLDAQNFVYA